MRVTQTDIARRVGIAVSSVSKILNRQTSANFSKEKIRDVLRTARELGYDLGRIKYAHERHQVRKDVMVAVEISVYGAQGGLHDCGTAVARNVSLSGAMLIAISLPRRTLPLGPCTIGLRQLAAALPTPEVLGRIVRFQHASDSVGFAVEFLQGQEERAAALYTGLPPGGRSGRREPAAR